MNIMNPYHARWGEFVGRLSTKLSAHSCDGTSILAFSVLEEMAVDKDESLEEMEKHGGMCDCEILMNVEQMC